MEVRWRVRCGGGGERRGGESESGSSEPVPPSFVGWSSSPSSRMVVEVWCESWGDGTSSAGLEPWAEGSMST